MRPFSAWVISLVASPSGVVILALLDSTPLLALPGGIDAAVIALVAGQQTKSWVVVLLATAGSLAGAMLTFWMGGKVGEHGLERYIPARRLARIRRKVQSVGAIELAVLDLIPPPFPFTPFILAAGALEVNTATFFRTLTVCRLVRFGSEAVLAMIYGQKILAWFDSDTFRTVVAGCGLLAVVLTVVSIAKLVRASRSSGRAAA